MLFTERPAQVAECFAIGAPIVEVAMVPFFDRTRLIAWLNDDVLFAEPYMRPVAYLDDKWRLFRFADGKFLGAVRDCAIRDPRGGVVAFFSPGASLGRRAAPIARPTQPSPRPPAIHNPGRPRKPARPVLGGVIWGASWRAFLEGDARRTAGALTLARNDVLALFEDAWRRARKALAPDARVPVTFDADDDDGQGRAEPPASSAC